MTCNLHGEGPGVPHHRSLLLFSAFHVFGHYKDPFVNFVVHLDTMVVNQEMKKWRLSQNCKKSFQVSYICMMLLQGKPGVIVSCCVAAGE